MARLWDRMTGAYGHRWSSTYAEVNDLWVRTLADLSDDQIARGLGKCVASGYEWPPSCGRFYQLCLGTYADYGLLEPQAAYTAATRGEMRHKGIYHTITTISTPYDFRRMDGGKAERLFLDGYELTLKACRQGEPLRHGSAPPDPARTLEHSSQRPWKPGELSRQIAERELRKMRELLDMERFKPKDRDEGNDT
jgi:hypothetical protein